MSIIIRTKSESWYTKLLAFIVSLTPEPGNLRLRGAAALLSLLSLGILYYLLGSDPLLIPLASLCLIFPLLAAHTACYHVYEMLYPMKVHDIMPNIRPMSLIMERDRIAGIETFDTVNCRCCGKTFEKLKATEKDFINILRDFLFLIIQFERKDIVDHKERLENLLRTYDVRLVEEETPLLHQFYTLEYDRSMRIMKAYRPPKEFEKLVGIKQSAVQIIDQTDRGDENNLIILTAFKIQYGWETYTVSTCLLGFMKNGHIWLNQTIHTLPPKLDDHLAWSMGLNPGDEIVEADRGGMIWRPRLTWRINHQSHASNGDKQS